MIISELDDRDLIHRFRNDGLVYGVGPFTIRGRSRLDELSRCLARLYGSFPVIAPEDIHEIFDVDYSVQACLANPWRFNLILDGRLLYARRERKLAVPFVEWALNNSVILGIHRFFVLHAGVVERNGAAAIFPGDAGQGKSTLSAALSCQGWRLLSDEVALIDPEDGLLQPAPRPVSLKNESIDLIQTFAPTAQLGPRWQGTSKGMVSHMIPPAESVHRARERARPGWLIFPQFTHGARPELTPCRKAQALVKAGRQAYNLTLHGKRGFEILADLVDKCECYDFVYSDLADAVAAMDALSKSVTHDAATTR